MSAPDIDYICVGICRVDPESGVCLGCGRPPWPLDEPQSVAVERSRYPVACELTLEAPAEASDGWEHLV